MIFRVFSNTETCFRAPFGKSYLKTNFVIAQFVNFPLPQTQVEFEFLWEAAGEKNTGCQGFKSLS